MPGTPLFDNPQITEPFWKWYHENEDHKLFQIDIALGMTKTFYLKNFKDTLELLIGVEPNATDSSSNT